MGYRDGITAILTHKQWASPFFDFAALRVTIIQDRTAGLLKKSEAAILDAIDAIKAAMASGATDEQLKQARHLHRRAQMRWDFIASENSMGFHSPQEAARWLGESIDYAR